MASVAAYGTSHQKLNLTACGLSPEVLELPRHESASHQPRLRTAVFVDPHVCQPVQGALLAVVAHRTDVDALDLVFGLERAEKIAQAIAGCLHRSSKRFIELRHILEYRLELMWRCQPPMDLCGCAWVVYSETA